MFGSLGLPELLVILLIVIIIFGANKLPQLGKGLGQGLRNFKESVKGDEAAAGQEPKRRRTGPEPAPRLVAARPADAAPRPLTSSW